MPRHTLARVAPDERRERLLSAAREIFLASGLKGARTKDIAERAGVAEGLIFKNFGSKEGLFEAAIIEPLEIILAEMAGYASDFGTTSGAGRARDSERFHAHILSTMLEIAPLLGVALFSDRERGQAFYREHLSPLIGEGAESLHEALRAWPHAPVDPRFLFLMFWGTHFAMALDHLYGEEPLDVATMSKEFARLLIRSLSPSTARTAASAKRVSPAKKPTTAKRRAQGSGA
jgi:AcrR family transcriptional regulator